MKRKDLWLRVLSCLLCAVLTVVFLPAPAVSAASASTASLSSEMTQEDLNTVSELNSAYEQLQKKLEDLEAEKKQIESDTKDAKKLKKNLDAKIETTQEQIDLLNDEITKLDGEIETLDARITVVSDDIDKNLAIFRQRIRAIYIAGRSGELELLLGSSDFIDLLTRAEILRRIAEYDNAIIVSLQKDLSELNQLHTDTETAAADKATAKKAMASKQNELQQAYDETEVLLDELGESADRTAEQISQYEKEMEDARKEIDDILSKYVSDIDEYVGGAFAWPLPGFTKITSPYGQRSSGFHTGTDIAGRNAEGDLCYGYPIVAANSGTVILVGDKGSKSYGKYLIIDHGGGCRTLYAHCSKVLVSTGDTVTKGQTIAKAGSTGNSTGPHLHFELWIDEVRVDPMDHLTKPSY